MAVSWRTNTPMMIAMWQQQDTGPTAKTKRDPDWKTLESSETLSSVVQLYY